MKYLRKFNENEEEDDKWAEEYRLWLSDKGQSAVKVTKNNLPKPGDKVRCIPGFTGGSGDENTPTYGGHGYKSGEIFTVDHIDQECNRPIIWPGKGHSGIYYDALEYII